MAVPSSRSGRRRRSTRTRKRGSCRTSWAGRSGCPARPKAAARAGGGESGGGGECGRVRIGSRAIAVAGAAPHAGAAVEIAMRPEDVRLLTAPDPEEKNCLAGEIVDVTYYGDRLEYAVRIDGTDERIVVSAA